MFAVTVELLAGRYVATQFNDRSKTEWPPHPARLFSAAVAAWADHGDHDKVERAALEWWETLDPPTISCSLGQYELAERNAVTHYVPVNDTSVVSRDTARTYEALNAAEAAFEADLDSKARTRAVKKVEKARAKADDDSRKATVGIAPLDRLAILPDHRAKQPRHFPTIVPQDPIVTYHWSPPPEQDVDLVATHLVALDALLARIGRLGHSSTPVSVVAIPNVDPDEIEVTLEPGVAARMIGLRVATDGQLENLIKAFEGSNQGTEPRTMPARIESYRRPDGSTQPLRSSIGDDWIVLQPAHGETISLRDVARVARTLRAALMSVAGAGGAAIPEVISGHKPRTNAGEATEPTHRPHLMVLGLPFSNHPRSTGEVLGLAVVLPRESSDHPVERSDWAVLSDTVERFLTERHGRLTFKGGSRPLELRRASLDDLPSTLRVERWQRPSASWVSITPVALSRNPGNLAHRDPTKRDAAMNAAEVSVATACEQIGLPRPTSVEISLGALVKGSRPVHTFPPARTGRLTRVQVHARLTFDEPVQGPIVLGAGRFQGLGLFAPEHTAAVPTQEAAS